MRVVIIAFLILGCPLYFLTQDMDRELQAEMVKDAVGRIAGGRSTRVEIVLRDLRRVNGDVVGVYSDSMAIAPKDRGTALITIARRARHAPSIIRYRDVLQLEGGGLVMSFVPDPDQTPYGSWQELDEIAVGEFMQIHLKNATTRNGVFLKKTENDITILRGNKQLNFGRDSVLRVYRITGNTRSVTNKLLRGAQKGVEITDDILPIGDARAMANSAALGIGAGIGALIYVLPKGAAKRVLVFAQ